MNSPTHTPLLSRRHCLILTGSTLLTSHAGTAIAAETPLVAPITLTGSRVALFVVINNSDPQLFALDTGGGISLIRNELAQKLNLRETRQARFSAGGHDGAHPVYDADDVRYGGIVRQPHVLFGGMKNFGFGDGIAGSLAAGFLTTLSSELDFEAREWRIWRHGGPDRGNRFTKLHSEIMQAGPEGWSSYLYADATLNGQPLRFLLDTGSPSVVRLNHNQAVRFGLWSDDRPWVPVQNGGRLVRADSLIFGDTTFSRPLTFLLPPAKRNYSGTTENENGLIGLPTLRCFTLSADPREGILWVRRNTLPPPPARYPMSGLWIDNHDETLTVLQVGTGSPAAQAGIRPGDRILNTTFAALLPLLRGDPGTIVPLTIESDGKRRDIPLQLQSYL
ncbi:PDZ domain-containing protein [Acetobacter fallax]|uniref:Signaling protein n=1 Tax=Acetobacter fallax TaxID=1737473 RepID=A0ABX0K994_9PROT|nr:PDZ domain-containing protein [Acetobacter fallax]NHO31541.1 signaling protein [Acetobacter fallax]NHO35100.1 signaling protein [Acetobacter fallax]